MTRKPKPPLRADLPAVPEPQKDLQVGQEGLWASRHHCSNLTEPGWHMEAHIQAWPPTKLVENREAFSTFKKDSISLMPFQSFSVAVD